MILIDYNQVLMSTINIQAKNADGLDEGLIRHIALNTLRHVRTRFKDRFGDLVICTDHGYSWRRDVYPYYKHCRRMSRKNDDRDWNEIFTILNKIRDEIRDTFHYPLIHVEKCEADDVIGVLCHEFGNTDEPILIYSGDKDFGQLQVYRNVHQFSPAQKKWIVIEDADKYLKEHIIRGDSGDGIPNFLSADDTFAAGGSQKRIYTTKVTKWLEQDPKDFCDENTHYERNRTLIDLTMTPGDLLEKILESYNDQLEKKDNNVLGYFTRNRLKNLMQNIEEFVNEARHSRDTENSLF